MAPFWRSRFRRDTYLRVRQQFQRLKVRHGLLLLSHQVNAETPDEWIALSARVHSGFGALVAVGVKIGLDAVKRPNQPLSVRLADSTANSR